jgi:hypothetical protein
VPRWLALGALWALAACNDRPLSWDSLVTRKITEQYPTYRVEQTAPGHLQVQRPGLSPVGVDLADIALRCQRGPRDCNTATDQLLLDLR